MSDWIDFDQWKDCARMERPGFVFEVENADGHRLLTPCTHILQLPWDWQSAPVRFRLATAPKPRHSQPIPEPQKRP
jgi:hypothetical protein